MLRPDPRPLIAALAALLLALSGAAWAAREWARPLPPAEGWSRFTKLEARAEAAPKKKTTKRRHGRR
jgi:hypothetical protein